MESRCLGSSWCGRFFRHSLRRKFATSAVCSYSGLIEGNVHQFTANVFAAVVVTVYVFVVTYILAFGIDRTIGLRVSEEEEYVGLDLSQHGEAPGNKAT